MKKKLINKYLNEEELLTISNKIKEIEKSTSGEIVLSIKERKSIFEQFKSLRQLAEKEFINCHIDKTKNKTGILFFLLLESKQFQILADAGINSKVEQDTWNTISEEMAKSFKLGNFCKGIIDGLSEAGSLLARHFPIRPEDVNELSNEVRLK